MRALDKEFVTVAEAATLLRVAPATVRRWIREGDVATYRIGRRRVALKRDDLSNLITPTEFGVETSGEVVGDQKWEPHRLTPEEQQGALETLDRPSGMLRRPPHAVEASSFLPRGSPLMSSEMSVLASCRDLRGRLGHGKADSR